MNLGQAWTFMHGSMYYVQLLIWQKKTDMTIIYVTHYAEEISYQCLTGLFYTKWIFIYTGNDERLI